MTSQKSFFDRSFFRPGMWLNSLRRSWPTILLFTIVLFFAMPVVMLIYAQSMRFPYEYSDTKEAVIIITGISRFLSMAMAFFSGTVFCRFMHERVSAYYYHSLPVSREAHYLHTVASGTAAYLFASVVNTGVCQLILLFNDKFDAAASGFLWQCMAQNLIFYMLFFSVMILAATLCGTSFVQIVISLVMIYILPVFALSTYALMEIYLPFFYSGAYLTSSYLSRLSFGIDIFYSFDDTMVLTAGRNVYYAVLVLITLALGLLIFKFRRAERAGSPFIFPRFGSVVKYTVMVPAMILSGMLFGEGLLGGNMFWQIFGYVCGALLTFMLVNAVSNKNAKDMFKNFRGFLIYSGVAAVVMACIMLDVFGINNFLPSASLVKSTYFDFSGSSGLEFEERESTEALLELSKKIQDIKLERANGDEIVLYEEDSGTFVYQTSNGTEKIHEPRNNYMVHITFECPLGIKVAKRYYIGTKEKEALAAELRAVADLPEFSEEYTKDFIEGDFSDIDYTAYSMFTDGMYYTFNEFDSYVSSKDILDIDFGRVTWDYFQHRRIGFLSLEERRGSYRYTSYPMFDNGSPLSEFFMQYDVSEENIDPSDILKSITVFNAENGKYINVTEPDDMRAILEGSVGNAVGFFTEVDTTYFYRLNPKDGYSGDIEYEYHMIYDDAYVKENGVTVALEESVLKGSINTSSTRFLSGKVPQFIIEHLG